MFGSFPPSLWLVCASKVYSGLGADIVYGIITLIELAPKGGFKKGLFSNGVANVLSFAIRMTV